MRVLKAIVNWLAILTLPIWALPYTVFFIVKEFDEETWKTLSGKRWFWE